ncbi:MAG: type 4a pilus biogenesis protein PilO [Candidatus Aminicenantes bacterium]|nr:type 4a pilus biogenesis protein PilO [Candidatus Aminicenantes bacterium]
MRDWPWYGHVVVALIIFCFLYLFLFKPKNQEITRVKEERIKTEREVVKLREKKKQLDKIEEELKTMSATLKELEAIIPQKKEIFNILRRIQQLAFDSRLNIAKFVPKGEIDKMFYAESPISLEITGNYHNLAIFFDRLSRFSRLFNIEDFTIKSLANQSEASTISATFTAKTYIFRESPPPQKETQKRTSRRK